MPTKLLSYDNKESSKKQKNNTFVYAEAAHWSKNKEDERSVTTSTRIGSALPLPVKTETTIGDLAA